MVHSLFFYSVLLTGTFFLVISFCELLIINFPYSSDSFSAMESRTMLFTTLWFCVAFPQSIIFQVIIWELEFIKTFMQM